MQFELSTGYKLWITKMGKKKKWDLLVSCRPNCNEFIKIGLIDSPKILYTVFTGKEYGKLDEIIKLTQKLDLYKNYTSQDSR